MIGVLLMILIGFVVGLLARAFKPGDDNMGFILTTALGVGGALLAGFVGRTLGWYDNNQTVGFFASVVGVVVLLFLANTLRGDSNQSKL